MVLQGDFGVTIGYNRPNHTVSITGATVEVTQATASITAVVKVVKDVG